MMLLRMLVDANVDDLTVVLQRHFHKVDVVVLLRVPSSS